VKKVQFIPRMWRGPSRHLVVDDETLRKMGTALNRGARSFFGPAGTGKTTMAECLARVLASDDVWIPHAV